MEAYLIEILERKEVVPYIFALFIIPNVVPTYSVNRPQLSVLHSFCSFWSRM